MYTGVFHSVYIHITDKYVELLGYLKTTITKIYCKQFYFFIMWEGNKESGRCVWDAYFHFHHV